MEQDKRTPECLRIGIVGAGKVGITLGKYLMLHDICVTGYYSRTEESAATAAEFTNTNLYKSLQELVQDSDTLFVATPDGEIGKVWDCMAQYKIAGKKICHFSGSLSSEIFSSMEATGAYGCSIHPVFPFGDKFQSYRQFHTARLTMEGDREAVDTMKCLFGERLGHKIYHLKREDKIKYHGACAIVSNYMIGLMQMGTSLLQECNFNREQATELLAPLVRANIENMLENGVENALTGPVERNDLETVRKHLQMLSERESVQMLSERESARDKTRENVGEYEKVYRSLGEVLVEISMRKHPERDYRLLQNMLKEI